MGKTSKQEKKNLKNSFSRDYNSAKNLFFKKVNFERFPRSGKELSDLAIVLKKKKQLENLESIRSALEEKIGCKSDGEMLCIAEMFDIGVDGFRDEKIAVTLYRMLAEANFVPALVRMAEIFEGHLGVKRNLFESFRLRYRASICGFSWDNRLTKMLSEKGVEEIFSSISNSGVVYDFIQAELGNYSSLSAPKRSFDCTAWEIEKKLKLFLELRLKTCPEKEKAQIKEFIERFKTAKLIRNFCIKQNSVSNSIINAFPGLVNTTDKNFAKVDYNFFAKYFSDLGDGADQGEIKNLLELALWEEDSGAIFSLAQHFEKGTLFPKNEIVAGKLYEAAAEDEENYDAIEKMGWLYFKGDLGFEKNPKKCLDSWLQIVRLGCDEYAMPWVDLSELCAGENVDKTILPFLFSELRRFSSELSFESNELQCAILNIFIRIISILKPETDIVDKIVFESKRLESVDRFEDGDQKVFPLIREVSEAANHYYREIALSAVRKEEREKATKSMFSYVTHTVHNALGTAPQGLKEAIKVFGETGFSSGNTEYRAIVMMAQISSTISFVESLINNFKILLADPGQIESAWDTKNDGTETIKSVLFTALRQSFSRFIFSANFVGQLKKMLGESSGKTVKEVRNDFLNKIMTIENPEEDGQLLFSWINKTIQGVDLRICDLPEAKFTSDSVKYTILFACISELIFNALKYSTLEKPIEISMKRVEDELVFCVSNSFSTESDSSTWSKSGLRFLREITSLISAVAIEVDDNDGFFVASLRLKIGNV